MKNKKVLIGLTGSIAAYKTAELVRLFKKAGADVKTVATESALLFLGEKTLETLSNNPVSVNMFEKRAETGHISLADWADVFVIAPASANTISKIAGGICDNLLTSIACAYSGKKKPLFVAPAMNDGMWNNPFVKENIQKLVSNGVQIINPVCGFLACGTTGVGKMAEPSDIFESVKNSFIVKKNKKIVITAGGTREYIDPVRFISNSSSGKTGYALAECAFNMGYDVTLIATCKMETPCNLVMVDTAQEMADCVQKEFKNADYLIMAAAVSDFKIKNYKNSKIRKNEIKNGLYNIELALNPDILKSVAQNKKAGQKVIGFSLSTENPVEVGFEKLKDKNCDYIIANGADALNKDTTSVFVINKTGVVKEIINAPKYEAARLILEIVL